MEIVINMDSLEISNDDIKEALFEKLYDLSIEEIVQIFDLNQPIKETIADNIARRYYDLVSGSLFKNDTEKTLIDLGKQALSDVISPIVDQFMSDHSKEINDALTEAMPQILFTSLTSHVSASFMQETLAHQRIIARNDSISLIRESFRKGGL